MLGEFIFVENKLMKMENAGEFVMPKWGIRLNYIHLLADDYIQPDISIGFNFIKKS